MFLNKFDWPLRSAQRMLVALFAIAAIWPMAGCGSGGAETALAGVPGTDSYVAPATTETGGLTLRINRSDLGLPPAGRAEEGESLLVTVDMTGSEGGHSGPHQQALEGESVTFTITGLAPGTWNVVVRVVDLSQDKTVANGQVSVAVERGQTTETFVPIVTAAPPATAGNINLGVGALVNVPNGTEVQAGSDQSWKVTAPAVYVNGTGHALGQKVRMRVELFATQGGDTRSNDSNISMVDYQSVTGDEPELETSSDGNLIRAIRMKAGDTMTIRWSQIPAFQKEVVVRAQRGALYENGFMGLEAYVKYVYPILNQG